MGVPGVAGSCHTGHVVYTSLKEMTMLLDAFEPKRVLHYFEEIAAIPHGSGNTRAISDHLVEFAKSKGLEYRQDSLGNVLIRKAASPGCESAPVVILQGHMDMVCEKDADCTLDMEKEGLDLRLYRRKELRWLSRELSPLQSPEDWFLKAEGTTLGSDDGIGVAYMMAILEAEDITHPALECVFTVDEEIGMLGAVGMDMSDLKGRLLMNIDSEDEGHVLAGCAGGCIATVTIPVEREDPEETMDSLLLRVEGLKGGHSGLEIDRGRANASVILGRLLQTLSLRFGQDIRLCSVNGGSKDNAIPRSAEAVLRVMPGIRQAVMELAAEEEGVFRREYAGCDPELQISCSVRTLEHPEEERNPVPVIRPLSRASEACAIRLLRILPNGIEKMSRDIPGLVETSLNLGILKTKENKIVASSLVRSGVNSEKEELLSRIAAVAEALGGTASYEGDYPAWEYRKESRLREVMQECYEAQYKEPIIVETVHAGVECGIFSDKLPGLDAVSFGPDLKDIHTAKEAMDLASVERTWKLILSVLKKLCE